MGLSAAKRSIISCEGEKRPPLVEGGEQPGGMKQINTKDIKHLQLHYTVGLQAGVELYVLGHQGCKLA